MRHRGRAELARAERLEELAHLGVLEDHDLVRDLAQRAADQREQIHVLGEAVARGLPVDVGDAEAQPFHHALLELERFRAERGLRPDRAHHAAHEHALFQLAHALVVAAHFGKPDRRLVTERDRQRLHAVRAPDHRRRLVLLGELRERLPDRFHVAQIDRVRFLDLQHGRRVEHVLRRRPEVDVLAEVAFAEILHGLQRRHERMLDAPDLRGDRLDVDVLDFRVARDLLRRFARNDAELGLLERERRFEVVPLLHAVAVVEYRPQLVGAPQMLDQCVVEYAGCHVTLEDVQPAHAVEQIDEPALVHRHVVALHALRSLAARRA